LRSISTLAVSFYVEVLRSISTLAVSFYVNDRHKAAAGGCTIPIADNTILSLTVAKKKIPRVPDLDRVESSILL
jgi:hypothetical protein